MSEFALHEVHGLGRVAGFADELLTVAGEAGSDQARGLGLLLHGEVGPLAGNDVSAVGRVAGALEERWAP